MNNIPIYKIIENDIKNQIKDKSLKPGDLVPSENELKEMYNVSRMTARQALSNLVNEGYLYRHRGKGTFISNRKIEKNIHGVRSFTEEMKEMNREVLNKVLSFVVKKVPKDLKDKLFLENDDEVICIERIRYGDNIPVLYEQLYISKKMFKTIDSEVFNHSFYQYVEKDQLFQISHCMQSIEALKANKDVAKHLEINKNDPVLLIVRNSFLNNGRPFEYVKSYYRADQYRLLQYAIKG